MVCLQDCSPSGGFLEYSLKVQDMMTSRQWLDDIFLVGLFQKAVKALPGGVYD